MIPVRLRDHVFYTAFAPYKNPKVAVALILENGGSDGVTAAPVMRQIMDHLFAPQDNTVQTVTTEQSGPIAVSPSNTDIKILSQVFGKAQHRHRLSVRHGGPRDVAVEIEIVSHPGTKRGVQQFTFR